MSGFHLALKKVRGNNNGEDATEKTAQSLARNFSGKRLRKRQEKVAGQLVHYIFGTGVGALYGVAVEYSPTAVAGAGGLFGCGVWLGAHVTAVPALGLAKPVWRSDVGMESAELVAHVAYGAICEAVRKQTREWLG
jgi:uncharacterized membrane protein YagU involved in acid resistance